MPSSIQISYFFVGNVIIDRFFREKNRDQRSALLSEIRHETKKVSVKTFSVSFIYPLGQYRLTEPPDQPALHVHHRK